MSGSMIDQLYECKIRKALGGDKAASKWLIEDFCNTIKNNRDGNGNPHRSPSGIHTQFDEKLLDYFQKCFEKILHGTPADNALGINKGKGGADAIPDNEKLARGRDWCLKILELRASGRYSTVKDAQQAAARHFKVSLSYIEKAWKNPTMKQAARLQFQRSKKRGKQSA